NRSTREFIGRPIAEAQGLRKQLCRLVRLYRLGRPFPLDQHRRPELVVSFLEDVTLGARLCQVLGSQGMAHNRGAKVDLLEGLGNATPIIQHAIADDQKSVLPRLPKHLASVLMYPSLYPNLYHTKR